MGHSPEDLINHTTEADRSFGRSHRYGDLNQSCLDAAHVLSPGYYFFLFSFFFPRLFT